MHACRVPLLGACMCSSGQPWYVFHGHSATLLQKFMDTCESISTEQLVVLIAGKTLRTFTGPVDDYAVGSAAGAGGAVNWPLFKWAGGKEDK